MKLRDSFISLKHISNGLNIPLDKIQSTAIEFSLSNYEPTGRKEKSISVEKVITDDNIKIIDKATKSSGLRVRNLKKSMLNDNRLIKLRNKLLKRSKSSAEISVKNVNTASNAKVYGDSKEEWQNKENESPKLHPSAQEVNYQNTPLIVSPIVTSPHRNRVKMGTRVFSSQFLNKSYDNIYDRACNGLGVMDAHDDDVHPNYDSQVKRAQMCAYDPPAHRKVCDPNDIVGSGDSDGLSLKSTSLSSLYFSEKMSEKFSESPLPSEAYVLRE